MTTIITTTGNNFATITADQGITSNLIHPDMHKIVQQDTWLIGVAGSARACDQLQYSIEYPKPPIEVVKSGEWMKWLVTKVIPLIDDTVKDTEMEAEALLITHGLYLTFLPTNPRPLPLTNSQGKHQRLDTVGKSF